MAVCWKCPVCDATICGTDPIGRDEPLKCGRCESLFMRADVRCVVCETSSTLIRRDSLHYLCTECGHVQTLWSLSA